MASAPDNRDFAAMIRRMRREDIPAVCKLMAAKVPHFRNHGVLFSFQTYALHLSRLLGSDNEDVACFVSEAQNSIAAAMLCYVIVHPTIGERVGGEATWVADPKFPGHGRKVLSAADEWFRGRGARRYFINCNDERTARLLGHLGLAETERVFEKVL
jgi:hypothetical protein